MLLIIFGLFSYLTASAAVFTPLLPDTPVFRSEEMFRPLDRGVTGFTESLYKGFQNPQVEELQKFLKQWPDVYPEGLVTGYFGLLTEAAVKRFQVKYGIVSSGTPETTGYGRVGAFTRAKLNELLVSAPVVAEEPAAREAIEIKPEPEPAVAVLSLEPVCKTRKIPSEYAAIQSAIDAACSGDVILISPGVYQENLFVKTNALTIQSEQGAEATIINPDKGLGIVLTDGVNSAVIDGLTVNTNLDNIAVYLNIPREEAAVTVKNSIIKNSSIGISVFAVAGSILLKNNLIINNKSFGIYDNAAYGGVVSAENNTIAKNNTGYYLDSVGGNHKLINNIIVSNREYGVAASQGSAEKEHEILKISYTNVWNNATENYYTFRRREKFTPSGINNFSTDPLFAGADNYQLRSNSIMIDAGDPAFSKDPDGTRADIGAYPFDQRTLPSGSQVKSSFLGNLLQVILGWFR